MNISLLNIHSFLLRQDPSVQKNTNTYPWKWEESGSAVELDDDWLIRGERYEARVRVKSEETDQSSTWSGWSPTASWVSTVGRTEQPQPPSGKDGQMSTD